ncbi:hypothetical protein MRB53_042349 [Persea americana]|nr:hypothetical protein MRB53_042349 [Persea americana]
MLLMEILGSDPGVSSVTNYSATSPSRKALVEECEHSGDIEEDVFKVKFFLIVLLHFEKVVELEVELKQAPVAP